LNLLAVRQTTRKRKRIRVKKVVLLCHFCGREPIDSCLFWTGRERRKFLGCAKCVEELKQGKKEVVVMGLKEYLALDPKKVDAWVQQRKGLRVEG
jgi:hypothetical protein